ncbi:hypothetical protein J1792_00495 [Streptomyces triculaminicus]|uniref:Uncharacterized protein n=2 Tax=Streptomyces TaxID=1883 RepID=A0A939FG33_9ACTN|nr:MULTISPECIES: hypothetical protein [Streptomyces]MBO0651331.1 hypothetical protein [Streptomyces triculaminicus]QSY49650.1 hypothetical protein J3S04_00490 [Streptomyces griseocarneus]
MPFRHTPRRTVRHTAVGALVTCLVLIAAPTAPAATAAPALPPGCTSGDLPAGGVHIVCTEGLRSSDGPLNGTDKADIIEVRGGDAVSGHLSGVVNGLGGDDVIVVDKILAGGSGGDIRGLVDGGDGDDEITVTDKDKWSVQGTVYGGAGNDTLTTGDVSYRGHINGGAGADVITTGAVTGTSIDGGDGNDTLRLASFRVTALDRTSRLDGGPGDDTITVGELGGPLHGGPGDDKITVERTSRLSSRLPTPVTVDGDEGNDVIRAGAIGTDSEARPVYLRGGAGADLIEAPSIGQAAYVTALGDDDDDVIQGPGGTAVVVGEYGTVDGGRGDNLCRIDHRAGGTVANCRA